MTVRIAVDTNVLLSGIIWPRWPYAILQHALQGDVELVLHYSSSRSDPRYPVTADLSA